MANYYGPDGKLSAGKENIKVYVFCNPTAALVTKVSGGSETTVNDDKWVDEVATLEEDGNGVTGKEIWGGDGHQDGFLMSTASATDINKKIPVNFSVWDSHTTADNAFNLSGDNGGAYDNNGDIRVERAVARFDFKDGSGNNNTYTGIVRDEEDKDLVNIRLTKMALVNMSKHFYYLRRVSANGLNTGASLCGTETKVNYVVDTDAADKNEGNLDGFKYNEHFNFCLGSGIGDAWTIDENTRGQWYTTEISDVTDNEEDNDKPWNDGDDVESSKKGYRIWRYVTENTIPMPQDGKIGQRHGISTGIVFKGKMEAANPDATDAVTMAIKNATGDSDTDPILYAYGDDLFVRWTQVRDYAIQHKDDNQAFYEIVFGKTTVVPKKGTGDAYAGATYSDDPDSPDCKWNAWFNNGKDKTKLKEFKKAATDAKFTLYQSSTEEGGVNPGYYCYYYYWNRHNDNGNPGVMGPMEFAVVRNNVYKLAVTKINRLGHPRISENDPDPEDPDKPDESGDVYLKLSVQVLPWVVRVNNIEF